MIVKMAIRNVKKSYKDYLIYFVTLSIAIMLFYIMNSISKSVIDGLFVDRESVREFANITISSMTNIMTFGLLFLIVYANRFIMKRRYKELGLYLLFGMSKRQVGYIITLETVFVALFSLIIGIGLGSILSQFVLHFVINIFNFNITVGITFSQDIIIKTFFVFSMMFLFTIILNGLVIAKVKLIHLFQYGKKVEKLPKTHILVSVILFIISVSVFAWLYMRLLDNKANLFDLIKNDLQSIIIIGIVNSFVFFYAISGFLLQFIKMSKSLFYRGLNSFTFRQLSGRIRSHFLSMTFISLFLFFGIAAMTLSVSFVTESSKSIRGLFHSDIMLLADENSNNIEKTMQETYQLTLENKYPIKQVTYRSEDREAFFRGEIMKVSDYNQIFKQQVILQATDVIVAIGRSGQVPTFTPKQLSAVLQTHITHVEMKEQSIIPYDAVVIVNDELFNQVKITGNQEDKLEVQSQEDKLEVQSMVVYEFKDKTNQFGKMSLSKFDEISQKLRNDLHIGRFISREVTYNGMNFGNFMLVILGSYLALILIISGITMLALQQLTQAVDSQMQYKVLAKLGVSTSMVHKSVIVQLIGYFVIPLLFGFINTLVGMNFIARIVKLELGFDLYGSIGPIFTQITTAYIIYGILTYILILRIIRSDSIK